MTTKPAFVTAICFVFLGLATVKCDVTAPYYGVRIGKFSTHFHEVRGEVYAVDDKTIFIKGFNYDGRGPDAFFWAGSSVRPDATGFVVPDDKGTLKGLTTYNGQDLVLRLPVGKEVTELRWLSVWSKTLNVNFGSLIFPKNLQTPKPVVIGPLENTSHGVSSGSITVLDTQTFLIPDFSYDGTGKQVFWLLSRGLKPNTGGTRLRDENGSDLPLKQYSKKTVVISVPDGHSVFDYDSLSVWSDHDIRDYGFVRLPREVLVPPSPRALGISLENKLNCEMLNDDLGFEVRWVINGDQLIMQLVSKIDPSEYMAFGMSSDDTESKFTSSDAIIAWLGPKGQGHVVDYFLMNTDKCDNGRGMCPDAVYEGASNSVTLMNAAKVNDYVMITFRRPLKADDKRYDQHVYTDGPQAVLWAVGTVSGNGEIEAPRLRTRGNLLMDFGREPLWNCPSPGSDMTMPLDSNSAVIREQSVPHVNCPTDLSFRAQLGPTNHREDGLERMWYINGLPSPTLTVQRGQVYTFLVEGGTTPPVHHPLYITSSTEGGLYQKVLERKEHEEIVFAGVIQDPATGGLLPTAEGRLCEWSSASMRGEPASVTASSFDIEDLPLKLSCGPGTAGKLEWLPDANTSDVVYYQSFTAKDMGGIIRVVDWCEETDPEGYLIETGKRPGSHSGNNPELELERESESIETGEAQHPESVEVVSPFYGEFQQLQEQELIPHDVQSDEEFRLPGEEIVEERIMNLQRGSQEKKKIDDFAKKSTKETEINKPDSVQSPYVRDDVETVDILRLKTNGEEPSIQRKVFVEPQNIANEAIKPNYRPLHLGDEPPVSKPPPNFSVQFEGGFVPLIRNPSKERDSPNFVPPPPPPFSSNQRTGSQKPFPFDANESVPFHGTFKPGVPDFSGFNISHYTQAPDIVPPNHAPEQYQGLHSVPKPHLSQRPLKPAIGHPQELFLRQQRPFTRPALVAYGPRPHLFQPQRQQPNQHILAQLPLKRRPEVFSSGSEDLDQGSSQRVQVALQNAGSEKIPQEETPAVHGSDITAYHGGLPVQLVASAPPIQRRPDIVAEDDAAITASQSRPPYNNYQPHRLPNNDATQSNVQYNLIPQMRPQRPTFPFRRPLPMSHRPVNIRVFPPGMNARPPQFMNHPEGLGRPLPLNHPFRHGLFHAQSMSSHPRPPHRTSEENVSEEIKKFQPEIFSSIPSLELAEGIHPKDEVIPVPSRETFGQSIKNRPQLIPATSPSKFPPQIFLQRPLNVNTDQESHRNSNQNLPGAEGSDEKFIPPAIQEPVVIRDPLPKPYMIPSPLSEENDGDELDIEESQDSAVELTQQADYDSPEEPADNLEVNLPIVSTESSDINKEKSETQSVLNHSLNPEHAFEDLDEVPGPFDVTQGGYVAPSQESFEKSLPKKEKNEIIKKETGEPSIHLPDEHLGEDISPSTEDINHEEIPASIEDTEDVEIPPSSDNVKYGERLPSSPQESEKNEDKRLPVISNRPLFFPVRRQPQFSSISTTEEPSTVTKDPIQRVKITPSPTASPNVNIWPGRKNILPLDGIDGHRMTESIPAKNLEEIQLPQVSQRPAAHDNGTDYSILTHVLSLIGGSPEPMEVIDPRTAT